MGLFEVLTLLFAGGTFLVALIALVVQIASAVKSGD